MSPKKRYLVVYRDNHNDTVFITIHCDYVESLNKYLIGFYYTGGILKKAIPSRDIISIQLEEQEENNNE